MAYRITYEWKREQELAHRHRLPVGMLLGALAVAAALAARLAFPQADQVIQELLHPLTDEVTVSAFREFVDQVGEGEPVAEAAAAFCQEIMANGS